MSANTVGISTPMASIASPKSAYGVKLVDASFLHGKHILFFAADFFNIPRQIIAQLVSMGNTVDYYDERPANNFITKSLIRLNRDFLYRSINNYYSRIIEDTKDRTYDYVFFIKGECVSAHSMELLRRYHPKAMFVLYQWDSISYNKHFGTIRPFFDKVLSFDMEDCIDYDMQFLPLFYSNDFAKAAQSRYQTTYDLMFVGTVHYDRFNFLQKISAQIAAYGGKTYEYLYFPHPLLYYKKKYVERLLTDAPSRLFKFSPLPCKELLKLYSCSKAVMDMQKPMQRGLTMRTFEALGAKCKLITTNANVAYYDFYNPENILIVDRNDPKVPKDFILSPYSPLPDDVYRAYSISNWLANMFNPTKADQR